MTDAQQDPNQTEGPTIGATVLDTPGAGRSAVGRALGSTVRTDTGTDISATALDARGTEGSAVGGTFRLVRILLCISHVDLPVSSDRAVNGTGSPGQAMREQHRPCRGYPGSAGEGTALTSAAVREAGRGAARRAPSSPGAPSPGGLRRWHNSPIPCPRPGGAA